MTAPAFCHLHVHTEYSLVDSTVRIGALIESCKAGGMQAVALTDQNNLFGMIKFYRKAHAAGIKPIIGADLRIGRGQNGQTLLQSPKVQHGSAH